MCSSAVKSQVMGNFILNGKGDEVKSKLFIESGLEWNYTMEGEKETLKSAGPLNEGIVVLVRETQQTCRTPAPETSTSYLIASV